MLVDNSIYRNAYDAPGNVRTFTISFPFLDASHVVVYQKIGEAEEVKVPASQYTISGAGDPRGGTLTMNTAPAAGTKIVILRDIPITQLYNYTELDNFPAESHENALAKLTMICQQLKEVSDRNLTVPATSDKTPAQVMTDIFTAQRESIESAASAASSATAAGASEQGAASYLAQTQQAKTEAVVAIQAQQSVSESAVEEAGDAQAVRLEQLASNILVSGTAYNKEATITLDQPIIAGTVVSLPVADDGQQMMYRVGASTLRMGFNGTLLFEGEQFEEVGNTGFISTSVKLLFDAEVGDVLNFFVYSQNVMVVVDEASGLSIDAQKRLSAAGIKAVADEAKEMAGELTELMDEKVDKTNPKDSEGRNLISSIRGILADDTGNFGMAALMSDFSFQYAPAGTGIATPNGGTWEFTMIVRGPDNSIYSIYSGVTSGGDYVIAGENNPNGGILICRRIG